MDACRRGLLHGSMLAEFGQNAKTCFGHEEQKISTEIPSNRGVIRVSGIHRRIRLVDGDGVDINNPSDAVDLVQTAASRPEAHHKDVCILDLGRHMTSAGYIRRSLEEIHSEETGGFSRWQRPEAAAEPQQLPAVLNYVGSSTYTMDVDDRVREASLQMMLNGVSNIGESTDSLDAMVGALLYSSSNSITSATITYRRSSSVQYNVEVNVRRPAASSFYEYLTSETVMEEFETVDHPSSKMPHNNVDMQQYIDYFQSNLLSTSEGLGNEQVTKDAEGLAIAMMDKQKCLTSTQVEEEHRVFNVDWNSIEHDSTKIISSPFFFPNGVPVIEETSLIEFLRAKKQNRDHFLDKIVTKADVYDCHPWHFSYGTANTVGGCLYFCCTTQYTNRGSVTRNRMTKEGGRWKQQGIVQSILSTREPARKTYLSYVARGRTISSSAYLVMAGRIKHRHRMVEIALEEDMECEKTRIKSKITPLPFLVVCILRMST